MANLQIELYAPGTHDYLIPALVDLHIQSIEFDDALLRFHPPFTDAKRESMKAFWKEHIEQIVAGRRVMIMALDKDTNGPTSSLTEEAAVTENPIAGIVELGLPESETGPFRADVEFFMVSPHHRMRGVGRRLMRELEQIALAKQRTLLQLGTTAGSVAERFVYLRLGYTKIGVVPNWGISPTTRELVHGVYFYKHLGLSEA